MAALAFFLAIAAGTAWAAALLPLRDRGPRWAAWLLLVSVGTGIGLGATSAVFSVLRMAGAAQPGALLAADFLLLAMGGWLAWRGGMPGARSGAGAASWIPAIALVCALLLLIAGVANMRTSNPYGELDALAGWNLKAKFLAAPGEAWKNAVSPLLVGGQPAGPLLLPAAIARGWTYAGEQQESYPHWLHLAFVLATVGLLTGAVTLLRGAALGCLAGVMLAGTHTWLTEIGTQYPDLLLGLLLLAALAPLALDAGSRNAALLAGFAASLGAWTLNEGFAALAILLAAAAVFAGVPRALTMATGALPVTALVLYFHTALSPGGSYAAAGLADGARAWNVVATFLAGILGLGGPFTHPLWMAGILIYVLRPGKDYATFRRLAGTVLLGTLVAGWILLVMKPGALTTESLQAVDRRIAQLAPGSILLLCAWLRRPE